MGVALIWGSTFLIVHFALNFCGPMFFVGARFVVAGLLTSLAMRGSLRGMTRQEVLAGSVIGITISLGYVLQTVGLKTISSSQSAFITALYVPLVPILQWMILRRAPSLMSWLGVLFAFGGLMMLSGASQGGLVLSFGELITVVSTVAIAAEIVLISRFAPQVDLRRVTILQLFVAGGVSLLGMPIFGEAWPAFHWGWAGAVIGLGIASALIQVTINWAQKAVSPTRATVIYAGEPVWGGVFGTMFGDRLPSTGVAGAALVVVGVLVSELKLRRAVNPELEAA